MRILAIDTSTERGTCALWLDGDCQERLCPPGQAHSASLLPLIGELLAQAGVAVRQLDGIAFAAGPGAFTGLRMACAAAQGLALGAGLPVLPLGTLDALAFDNGEEECLAVLDARMGEVYTAAFCCRDGVPVRRGDIRLLAPESVELPAAGGAVVGNALLAYPQLAARVASAGLVAKPEAMPGARAVAVLAAPLLAAGKGIDPALAAPLYVRDKVAQTVVERLAGGGKA